MKKKTAVLLFFNAMNFKFEIKADFFFFWWKGNGLRHAVDAGSYS